MKIYAIADLHLSFHENIDKPMSVFGDGWDHYEERLKAAWCERIGPEDLTLLPGDLSWGLRMEEAAADLEWIHALPGRKVLLRGNHDLWWNRIQYLNTLYDDMYFLQNSCYITEDRKVAIAGTRGWTLPGGDDDTEHDRKVRRRELMRLEMSLKEAKASGAPVTIACMHYPPAEQARPASDFTGLLERYDVRLCVYGHLHGQQAFQKGIRGLHRGIEYRLVSLDYLGAVPKQIYDTEKESLP